jgi:hypothetical protein
VLWRNEPVLWRNDRSGKANDPDGYEQVVPPLRAASPPRGNYPHRDQDQRSQSGLPGNIRRRWRGESGPSGRSSSRVRRTRRRAPST